MVVRLVVKPLRISEKALPRFSLQGVFLIILPFVADFFRFLRYGDRCIMYHFRNSSRGCMRKLGENLFNALVFICPIAQGIRNVKILATNMTVYASVGSAVTRFVRIIFIVALQQVEEICLHIECALNQKAVLPATAKVQLMLIGVVQKIIELLLFNNHVISPVQSLTK